jgi:hypothetical protein
MNHKDLINKHRQERDIHEEHTDDVINKFIDKFYPDRYILNRTDEWQHYDYIVYDKINKSYCKVEAKERYFNHEQYNKYKKEGFALSYHKLNTADVILYYIPLTNEILQIRTSKIKQLLNENKIKTVIKSVDKYQYSKELGKHTQHLVLIPYEYWRVYNM